MKKTNRLERLSKFMRYTRRMRGFVLAMLVATLTVVMPTAVQSSAASVSVDINGSALYTRQDLLKSGVTYVPLRAFADAVYGGFTITWNSFTRTATVQDGDYVLQARVGNWYILVNGNRIYADAANLLIGNRIHVPVRSVCTAMGLGVNWNATSRKVTVSGHYDEDKQTGSESVSPPTGGNTNQSGVINQDELYWLARIIHAESAGEPMAGKVAVGTVVMNRVKSSMYPNTVYGVIFDRKYGTQFTPVASGTIYNNPSAESIEAARRVLNGERTNSRILFFVNEKLVPNNWVSKNRTYVMKIGNHTFYA